MKLFTALESYAPNSTLNHLSTEELRDTLHENLATVTKLTDDYTYAVEACQQLAKLERMGNTNPTLYAFTLETISHQLGFEDDSEGEVESEGIMKKIGNFGRSVWAKIVTAWKAIKEATISLLGRGTDVEKRFIKAKNASIADAKVKAKEMNSEQQARVRSVNDIQTGLLDKQRIHKDVNKVLDIKNIKSEYNTSATSKIKAKKETSWIGIHYTASYAFTGYEITPGDSETTTDGVDPVEYVRGDKLVRAALKRLIDFQDAVIAANESNPTQGVIKNSVEISKALAKDIKTYSRYISNVEKFVNAVAPAPTASV